LESLMSLRIGALAERTGVNAPTIRYYEQIGLLPRPDRQDGGQRAYGDDDIRRLTFIRRCRGFGFAIDEVRDLLALTREPGRRCGEALDLGRARLAAVRTQLAELQALEASLAGFVGVCETTCSGGPGPDCVVLLDLATPAAHG
jgi:DNA-binding transcriptional MerR regulator